MADWSPVPVKNGYLLKPPDWISQDNLEGDSPYWEDLFALIILPWQTQNRSDPLPPGSHHLILIHDFPLDYWHPIYFRQAVSGMGNLIGVSQDGLRGSDKASLCLKIECFDLGLIPRILRVGHGNRWSDCLVERIAEQDPPEQPPPPDPEGGDAPRFPPVGRIHNHTVRPYIPPARRGALISRVMSEEPPRRGAPAAQETSSLVGFTSRVNAPSLSKVVHEIQKNDAGTQGSKRQTPQALQNQLTDSSGLLAKRAEEGPKIRIETNATCRPVTGLGRFLIPKESSSDHLKERERDTCMRINTVSSVRHKVTKVEGNLTLYPKPHQFNTPFSPCKSFLSQKPLLSASKPISHFKPPQTTPMA